MFNCDDHVIGFLTLRSPGNYVLATRVHTMCNPSAKRNLFVLTQYLTELCSVNHFLCGKRLHQHLAMATHNIMSTCGTLTCISGAFVVSLIKIFLFISRYFTHAYPIEEVYVLVVSEHGVAKHRYSPDPYVLTYSSARATRARLRLSDSITLHADARASSTISA